MEIPLERAVPLVELPSLGRVRGSDLLSARFSERLEEDRHLARWRTAVCPL